MSMWLLIYAEISSYDSFCQQHRNINYVVMCWLVKHHYIGFIRFATNVLLLKILVTIYFLLADTSVSPNQEPLRSNENVHSIVAANIVELTEHSMLSMVEIIAHFTDQEDEYLKDFFLKTKPIGRK